MTFTKVFDEASGTEVYEVTEIQPHHNHERDITILPNTVLYAINDYVTSFGQDA